MFQILIVDDDVEHVRMMRQMLSYHPRGDEFNVSCISDPDELGARLALGSCNIVLMGILFGAGKPDGIELVREYFPSGCGTQVIYVTSHIEYCTSVYRTDHVYFLTKPVRQHELDDALDKALANLENAEDGVIGVHVGSSIVALQVRTISYVESDRRKVRIHVPECSVLETYATLVSMKEQLPSTFVHCHQSFLVNMGHIVELRRSSILLRSGEVVPVSQKKRKATHEALTAYLRGRPQLA